MCVDVIPGCVRQGEAPLQGDASVHQEFAEQQRRVAGGVSRGVTGGHPGGSAGRAGRRLCFQLDGLGAGAGEGPGLPRAFTEGLTHAAVRGLSENICFMLTSCAAPSVLTGGPGRPSQLHSSENNSQVCLVMMSYIFRDAHGNLKTHRSTVASRLQYPHHLSQQSYVQALLMDTDTSAGLSPPLSGKLCLHSTEPCLNMARPEL